MSNGCWLFIDASDELVNESEEWVGSDVEDGVRVEVTLVTDGEWIGGTGIKSIFARFSILGRTFTFEEDEPIERARFTGYRNLIEMDPSELNKTIHMYNIYSIIITNSYHRYLRFNFNSINSTSLQLTYVPLLFRNRPLTKVINDFRLRSTFTHLSLYQVIHIYWNSYKVIYFLIDLCSPGCFQSRWCKLASFSENQLKRL